MMASITAKHPVMLEHHISDERDAASTTAGVVSPMETQKLCRVGMMV